MTSNREIDRLCSCVLMVKTNKKYLVITPIAALVIAVVAIMYLTETERTASAQSLAPSTTGPNRTAIEFSKLFQQRIKSPFPHLDANIVYETPRTVVLQGDAKTLIGTPSNSYEVDNYYLWQGVDIVKGYGYKIDSVVATGTGTTSDNPVRFLVVMSRP